MPQNLYVVVGADGLAGTFSTLSRAFDHAESLSINLPDTAFRVFTSSVNDTESTTWRATFRNGRIILGMIGQQ